MDKQTTTIHQLTPYQIFALKSLFQRETIYQVGIHQEGPVTVEYGPANTVPKTITIPRMEGVTVAEHYPFKFEWIAAPGLEGLSQLHKDELELLSPPGATIQESMEARGIELPLFCLHMGLTPDAAQALLTGDMILTPYIADQLEDLFNVDAQFWLNLEANYRKKLLKLQKNPGD